MTRVCAKCKVGKPLEDFPAHRSCKEGRRPECKDCSRAWHREYGMSVREKRAERGKAWREANPERFRAALRDNYLRNKPAFVARAKQWAKDNPEKARSHNVAMQAKRRAAVAGSLCAKEAYAKVFSLRHNAVDCHWCGKAMPNGAEHIDHVLPISKGGPHEPNNLVPSCQSCNLRKAASLGWKRRIS